MRVALVWAFALVMLFLGVASAGAFTVRDISIASFAFTPQFDTVIVHDSVVWTNMDAATHTTKSSSANGNFSDPWNSGSLGNGGVYGRKFDKLGVFNFQCGIHGSMTGKVVVITSFAAAPETWSRLKQKYRSKPAPRIGARKAAGKRARPSNGFASQER